MRAEQKRTEQLAYPVHRQRCVQNQIHTHAVNSFIGPFPKPFTVPINL